MLLKQTLARWATRVVLGMGVVLAQVVWAQDIVIGSKGFLCGTGTISTTEVSGYGSLLEITKGGREPLTLESGETRRFLEDGDTVTLLARASRATS